MVMEPYVIEQNRTSLINQIVITGLLVFLASIILTLFFSRIGDIAPITHQFLVMTTWIILPLIWAVLSIRELVNWSKASYTLLDDSLHVYKKGFFGSSLEDLYRYDSILSVSNSGRRHGAYGTITLRIAHHDDVILQHVAHPAKQAAKIKQLVHKNRRSTNFI